jgi:glycoside/pentoside/hexuronide:cation symporter, GPH family
MSNATPSTNKVPFGQKVAFGLGMLANQMFPAALGIFMVVLVQDLGFPGWMWGLLFFLPRFYDSIIDLIMGFITDNTRSVWGKRRHYVFIGAIILGISFVAMWQLHRENSLEYNFTYFLIWSFVFYTGLTIFSIPYVAMGYEMSDDFHERTSIMAVAQWIGQWAWVIAPWFWIIMYDPEWFENADTATRTLSVGVGIGCMILAMIPAIFIKSKSTKDDDTLIPLSLRNMKIGLLEIWDGFKAAFVIPQFRKLCLSTFLIFNAFNTVASFSFFIIIYYLFNGNAKAAGIWPTLFGSVGALITTFAVIPTVAWLSKKLGKKNAFMVSQGISIIGYILFWFLFVPGKPYMYMFALPFFSFGIGSLFTLMMSMTADVCDLDELNTGKRREGIFGAIYWWMVKLGFAIAGLLSGIIMSYVGFTPDAETQPEGAVTGLRIFFSLVPITGTLIAMWMMKDYDVSEARALEIRAAIDLKKAGATGTSSAYLPGKLRALSAGLNLNTHSGLDFSGKTTAELKAMFAQTLQNGMHGICFSPYAEGQNTSDTLSETQIRRRVDIIAPHTQWVRTFSCTQGNELTPKVAREKGLKTLVGAWISSDKARNEREIQALVQLAEAGLVDIAAVGNEVLQRNEASEAEIVAYLRRVRELLPKHIPLGYVDAYYHFLDKPELVAACDVLLINCYPFWEGADNAHALQYMQRMYALTQAVAGNKKVIITETGWPSKGQNVEGAQPSAENAMKYFLNAQQWAKADGVELFYFSSFDESWKLHHEGEVGTQWGLWDIHEKQKFA